MDEVVFFRNDPSNALYLIKRGKISVNIDIEDGFEVLNTIKTGESFGENTLLEESNRLYTSIIHSDSAELYVLPKVNIDEIFESHLIIKAKMQESLTEIYNSMMANLFKGYRSSMGLFNLNQIYTG